MWNICSLGKHLRETESWNLLTWTFSKVFPSFILMRRSSVVILGVIFFIMIFLCFLKDRYSATAAWICPYILFQVFYIFLSFEVDCYPTSWKKVCIVHFNFFSCCSSDSPLDFRGVFLVLDLVHEVVFTWLFCTFDSYLSRSWFRFVSVTNISFWFSKLKSVPCFWGVPFIFFLVNLLML